jgi:hypothetical protein
MYLTGLIIAAVDVLVALVLTDTTTRSDVKNHTPE